VKGFRLNEFLLIDEKVDIFNRDCAYNLIVGVKCNRYFMNTGIPVLMLFLHVLRIKLIQWYIEVPVS